MELESQCLNCLKQFMNKLYKENLLHQIFSLYI